MHVKWSNKTDDIGIA